jgi:hypothetical protein
LYPNAQRGVLQGRAVEPSLRQNMSDKVREMIAKAAAGANAQISAVQKGEYRPKIEVITSGIRDRRVTRVVA